MNGGAPGKFLSHALVSETVSSTYNLLTTAGQIVNLIKLSSTTEAAVKDFQNAVSMLLFIPYLLWLNHYPCCSSKGALYCI